MKFLVVVALAIATVVAKPEADPVYYNGVYAPSVYAAPSVYGYANAYNPYGAVHYIGKRSADAEPKADPLYYVNNVAGVSPLVTYNTPVTTLGYTAYNPYAVHYVGKRSADAEPEAKSDALYYNGVYNGYQPYVTGYGYQPLATTYGYGFPTAGYRYIGKRSADAEPEAKPQYFGGYGYGGYGYGYPYSTYGYYG